MFKPSTLGQKNGTEVPAVDVQDAGLQGGVRAFRGETLLPAYVGAELQWRGQAGGAHIDAIAVDAGHNVLIRPQRCTTKCREGGLIETFGGTNPDRGEHLAARLAFGQHGGEALRAMAPPVAGQYERRRLTGIVSCERESDHSRGVALTQKNRRAGGERMLCRRRVT